MNEKNLNIKDFTYELPEEKIAKYPLAERNKSKLLVYDLSKIHEDIFHNIDKYLAKESLLILNNSKVIPARLNFQNETGATIEIFCLEPANGITHQEALEKIGKSEWNCMIGNLKRWKQEALNKTIEHGSGNINIKALFADKHNNIVKFEWDTQHSFAEILFLVGALPIPPYLKRDTEKSDLQNYQTVYAQIQGSVAAPTAGLHFTQKEFDKLKEKNIVINNICLHVGAGTFKPVKAEFIGDHNMHEEIFTIEKNVLENIINQLKFNRPIVAVGTTSTRTLESLYYIGCKIKKCETNLNVSQWEAYNTPNIDTIESLIYLYNYLESKNITTLICSTQIMIVPGFKFRIVNQLVTNFHQPNSTLLLLIAAATNNNWKEIYHFALNNNYRFLSYGDSSLITINNKLH